MNLLNKSANKILIGLIHACSHFKFAILFCIISSISVVYQSCYVPRPLALIKYILVGIEAIILTKLNILDQNLFPEQLILYLYGMCRYDFFSNQN